MCECVCIQSDSDRASEIGYSVEKRALLFDLNIVSHRIYWNSHTNPHTIGRMGSFKRDKKEEENGKSKKSTFVGINIAQLRIQ